MTIDRWVIRAASALVLVGLGLGIYLQPNWFWLSAFVGASLLQASFTGFCPMALILKRLGVKSGAAF